MSTLHMFTATTLLIASLWLGSALAHVAPWHKGMYCLNGPTANQDLNSYSIVYPLYQLSKKDWWFHHIDGCDQFPPAEGDYLDLPAGGQFTVEIGSNRAKTSLSYGGRDMSDWPDGNHYPDNYNLPSCIISPNLHTQNQSMAAGTAFAISYESDITKVTPENLVVFTIRHNTPWKRELIYDVPAAMPACPPGGCICAWGWVPNGCGQPNMYHQPFKCRVTGATSNTAVAAAKPPVWCEGNPGGCTKGAKQMVYWNQLDGNNIQVDGFDQSGQHKSPGYNNKLGFADGAQNDIFGSASSGGYSTPTSTSSQPKPTSKSSSGTPTNTPQPSSTSPGGSQSKPTPNVNLNNGSGSGSGSGTPPKNPKPPGANSNASTKPSTPAPLSKPTDPARSCRRRGSKRALSKKSAVERSLTPAGPSMHKRYVRVHARRGGGTQPTW